MQQADRKGGVMMLRVILPLCLALVAGLGITQSAAAQTDDQPDTGVRYDSYPHPNSPGGLMPHMVAFTSSPRWAGFGPSKSSGRIRGI